MRTALLFLMWFIVIMSITNLIRMMLYLVGGDIYAIKQARRRKDAKSLPPFEPRVSLIIPAHNEELVIKKTLKSVIASDYKNLEVIVVDDSSTDRTDAIVREFIQQLPGSRVEAKLETTVQPAARRAKLQPGRAKLTAVVDQARRIHQRQFVRVPKVTIRTVKITQRRMGKAGGLNNAIVNYATGDLIMCLDADSLIAPDGVRRAVEYFRDPEVAAVASDVNILEDGSILGLAQRFEYLISYHMKKAQTTYNIEYIIGGVGSMFRRDVLEAVDYYDTDVVTEDIDLTIKVIAKGNKKYRVVYAADCLTYTEAVPSFKSLIKQRYRWKYGRMQTFLKHPEIFFSRDKEQSKLLSWFILPQAIVQEALFALEPAVVTLILGESILYRDPYTFMVTLLVISSYILVNIWSTSHLSIKERLRLSFYAPSMYIALYAMSVVEYIALVQSLVKLPKLRQSISGKVHTSWASPERSGVSVRSAA